MLVAVIIPSYKVKDHILGVLERIGSEVSKIYIVDDKCPFQSGDFVESHNKDPRVKVIRNPTNLGVGGATLPVNFAAASTLRVNLMWFTKSWLTSPVAGRPLIC